MLYISLYLQKKITKKIFLIEKFSLFGYFFIEHFHCFLKTNISLDLYHVSRKKQYIWQPIVSRVEFEMGSGVFD
jgi:hypothetical protein